MLAESFRLVTGRLIPRRFPCKQALLLAVCILSGCGGPGGGNPQQQWKLVELPPYRFHVPAGWTPVVGRSSYEAKHGSDLVQVQRFPLVHPYTDGLFAKVEPELAARITQVAKDSGGTVSAHRDVTVAGIRSHQYDMEAEGHTYRYTFVLHEKTEFLLVCRAASKVCDELQSSFQSARA